MLANRLLAEVVFLKCNRATWSPSNYVTVNEVGSQGVFSFSDEKDVSPVIYLDVMTVADAC